MGKFFTVIARFFASIFSILFVITTILALLLTTINRQMFNANLYKNALAEQNIYERFPSTLGIILTSSISFNPCAGNPMACEDISPELKACYEQAVGNERYITLAGGQDQPTDAEQARIQACLDQYDSPAQTATLGGSGGGNWMPSFLQNLTAENWQAILTILLPPDNLQTMTESTLDQMFAYLNGETDTVTVPLDKLKERLTDPAGIDLIMQLINSQPPCTEQVLEQLVQMVSGTSNGGMVLCKPPEVLVPIVVLLLQEQLNAVATQLPDKATIIKPPPPGTIPPGTSPFGADPLTTVRIIRLMMRLSPLLPLAFLLLVTLFAVRSIKSWMRWWGIPIFVSGTVALSVGISALPALNMAWIMYIVPRIPPFIPADIAGIGQELARSIAHTITEMIGLWAIILLAVGLAMWIGSYFFKTKNATAMPVTPPTPAP
jgi:hypothetical protein